MKHKFIIIIFLMMASGCATFENAFNKNSSDKINLDEYKYKSFNAKGIIKFETRSQKTSSRFNFIKNKNNEEIEFLNMFNNPVISFILKDNEIIIKNSKKNINTEAIKEVVNREVFKKIILNFSKILTGRIENIESFEKYENGLYKSLKNDNYKVHYKMYNDKFLPVIMFVDFFNISFNLKIINWENVE